MHTDLLCVVSGVHIFLLNKYKIHTQCNQDTLYWAKCLCGRKPRRRSLISTQHFWCHGRNGNAAVTLRYIRNHIASISAVVDHSWEQLHWSHSENLSRAEMFAFLQGHLLLLRISIWATGYHKLHHMPKCMSLRLHSSTQLIVTFGKICRQ